MPDHAQLQLISGQFERAEVTGEQYLELLMRQVSVQLGCVRSGLRLFTGDGPTRVARCVAMYDASASLIVPAADIVHDESGPYLQGLRHSGCVIIDFDASAASGTDALQDYLRIVGAASVLDMGFSVNGALFGAFSCERDAASQPWSQRHIQLLRKIASRASLTLMHAVNSSTDSGPGAFWEPSTLTRLVTVPVGLRASNAP